MKSIKSPLIGIRAKQGKLPHLMKYSLGGGCCVCVGAKQAKSEKCPEGHVPHGNTHHPTPDALI